MDIGDIVWIVDESPVELHKCIIVRIDPYGYLLYDTIRNNITRAEYMYESEREANSDYIDAVCGEIDYYKERMEKYQELLDKLTTEKYG